MKQAKRLLSVLLLCAMLLPMLPVTALTAWAETVKSTATDATDAMEEIEADGALSAFKQGETQRYDSDGYIGIPYEVTVYYDYTGFGKATTGYMTKGATPVILYAVNTNVERIGTDSDTDIIKSMLARGYAVVVADYLGSDKAKSPDLDYSSRKLRTKARAGEFFKSFSDRLPVGTYNDTLTVPAGYDVRLNDVYFELDKHGVDGTLEEIVELWNSDFRGCRGDRVIKWVRADGSRKLTQNGLDGSSPVWYADAAGNTVDAENGTYIRAKHTKAEVITDCVKADGSPIDLNLYAHTVYPTHPAKDVPVMVLHSSSHYLTDCINKEDRPQFEGFLFGGYAGMLADYAYVPMTRDDHYGSYSGDASSGVTGVNMSYATYTYNATQSATASLRMARYLALSEPDTYRFDVDAVGSYGISKTAWYTQLGAASLRDVATTADGYTEAELAQYVNDKINSFVQLLLPDQCSGRTRYDNGITAAYTKDGATIDGGELQPFAVFGGKEIASGAQTVYSSCGGFVDYFNADYSPLFISVNLSDTANTEYGQQNIMVNLCRTMDIPCLWYEIDIEHTFASGPDVNFGVDTYKAFFDFCNYYLKNTPLSVSHVSPKGGVIDTNQGFTVKFIGQISAEEIARATVTDASGRAVEGYWTDAYGDTEWTFTPKSPKGGEAYTLTIPANTVGSNGVAIGEALTYTFYTRAEGQTSILAEDRVLDESGTRVSFTVPEKSASGYKLRVYVANDAANTLSAYDASGELMGSVRVTGRGYHEIDVTDYLAPLSVGASVTATLRTEHAGESVKHYEATFDTSTDGLSFAYSKTTAGVTVDSAKTLKIVRGISTHPGAFDYYPNMENSYTLATGKLIKNGTAVTKDDLGRTFLITLRVYDTVSRPVRIYMNDTVNRNTKQLDFDRCYYTFQTKENGWSEFTFPYTVYEMKYGVKSQTKTLYVQFTPQGGCDGAPIYLDNLLVEEKFTDLDVRSVTLVSEADSDKAVKAPVSDKPFRIGSTEYTSWKAAVNAATSGSTIVMQRNYTLSEVVKLGGKGEITIDLGGYRLTTTNIYDAPLWMDANNTSDASVTLKNGSVILGHTALVGYGSSSAAGSGKRVTVNVENVYLTVAPHSDSLYVVSRGDINAGIKVESSITLTDCVIDVQRENLPDKTTSGVEVFASGNADLRVRYTIAGGTVKMNDFHVVTFCESVINAEANADGEYVRVLVPTGIAPPKASMKKGSDYATLVANAPVDGYTVYTVEVSKNSTDYGAIPDDYADEKKYPFVIFSNGAFIEGAINWKTVNILVREFLGANPGATVDVLLRDDYTSETYIGNNNWLCFMNGHFVLDLGGNTMLSSQSLFEAGVDSKYGGGFDTYFTVKNGTVLVGGGNMCAAQQNSNNAKYMNILFEDVTFGLDLATFSTTRNALFYGSNNSGVSARLTLDLTLRDCTIDLRGVPCNYTVFRYGNTKNSIAANVSVEGGALLTDSASIGRITWYTEDTSGAVDSVIFKKNAEGQLVTLSVTSGTKPTVTLPTASVPLSFSELLFDGEDYDIYGLVDDSIPSKYGAIPSGASNNIFVIFKSGRYVGAKDTWKDTLALVRETLSNAPGGEVQILMQGDREITSYVGNANWFCYMNGSILLDMDGHKLVSKTTSIFEFGGDTNYNGTYATTLTVKNGSVLQGNGNVFAVQNNSTYAKKFKVSFEDVTFGIEPAYFDPAKRKSFFYAQTNCKASVDLSLTLTDCTLDMTGISTQYTFFSFKSSDSFVSADIRINGGKLLADSFDTLTLATYDTSNDTFYWGKGKTGAFPTLTLPASYVLSEPIGGTTATDTAVVFKDGVISGDKKIYSMKENLLVTPYGNIPAAYEDVDVSPFALFDASGNFVKTASSFKKALEEAQTYLNSNAGKTVYVFLRKDGMDNGGGFTSAGVLNGTLVLDLGKHVLLRGDNSLFELNNRNLSEAQSKVVTNIIVKNGFLLAGKTSSSNGNIAAVQSFSSYDKTYNLTFENVTFGVSKVNYNPEKGMNNIILSSGTPSNGATGKITANVLLRNCTVDISDTENTVVPPSARLFHFSTDYVNVTIEGGVYLGSASKITFAGGAAGHNGKVTFRKNSAGKYFYFDLTAGAAPTDVFASDSGDATFVKISDHVYAIATAVEEFGGAMIPGDVYDDPEGYPFIVYVPGKLVGALTTWNAAQAAAKTYLDANAGGTVYIQMRADHTHAIWYPSDGVFNGTVVLDLGGHTLYRGEHSLLEACTYGLSADQCRFVSKLIIKNGTILAGKATSATGHILAVQANNAYDKTVDITFENVVFGVSKRDYSADKGITNLLLSDNGRGSGATGTVTANLLLRDCTFKLVDGETTVVPKTVNLFKMGDINKISVVIEGGSLEGTMNGVTFASIGMGGSLTFRKNEKGEYFRFVLNSGSPITEEVNTDAGKGYFFHAGNGVYLLNIGLAEFTGAAVTLGDDLSVRYYVNVIDKSLLEQALSVRFTVGGRSVTVRDYTVENGEYVITLDGIAPQQMGDLIDAEILVGKTLISSHKGYSIKKNLQSLLASSAAELGISEEKHAAMRTLIADLLTYGAAAQIYTGYKTDSPVTDGVAGLVPSTVTPTEREAMTLTGGENSIAFFGKATVHFDTANSIRVTAVGVGDAARVTVKVDGVSYRLDEGVQSGEGLYVFSTADILATGFDTRHVFELLVDGETVAVLSYSINSYAYAMLSGGAESESMEALALALYRLGVSADAYAVLH